MVTLAKMLLALLLAMGYRDSVSLKGVGPGKLCMLQQMFLNKYYTDYTKWAPWA